MTAMRVILGYSWIDLLEQLQPFAADRCLEIGEAGNIASRPCMRLHEAGSDRLRDADKHDRYGASFPLERGGGRRGTRQQHIRLESHQFLCEVDSEAISAEASRSQNMVDGHTDSKEACPRRQMCI